MKMKKMVLLAFSMCLAMSFTANAGTWRSGTAENTGRWWYDNEDGSYAANGWQWIDGNQDGISECYYFDENGWMAADGITPDGWQVNENGAWVRDGQIETRREEENMRIQVQVNGQTVKFELNDSNAAKMLYEQLPLFIEVQNFSNNEKIFYPPEKLDTNGASLTRGGAGTLAYYEPWGNVVMFYGDFRSNGDLFELGRSVEGSEAIGNMSGTLQIERSE